MKTDDSINNALQDITEQMIGMYTIGGDQDIYHEFHTMKGLALDTMIGGDMFQIQVLVTRNTDRFINQEVGDDDYIRIMLD